MTLIRRLNGALARRRRMPGTPLLTGWRGCDSSTSSHCELLTPAADAAFPAGRRFDRLTRVTIVPADGQPDDDAMRLAIGHSEARHLASGPDHWQAVEALLRAVLAEHERYWRQHQDTGHRCSGYVACHLAQAARPLAEQILRDLGGPG